MAAPTLSELSRKIPFPNRVQGKHLQRSFRVLREGGKLVCYGFYNAVIGKGGNIPLDFLRLQMWNLLPNHRSTALYSIGATRKKHLKWFSQDLTTLFNWLKQKKITPIIARKLPMTEAAQAYELIENAQVKGKVILEVASHLS